MILTKTKNRYFTKFESDLGCVVFGFELMSFDLLSKEFEGVNLRSIHQVHSDTVVEAAVKPQKADAHYTTLQKTALLVQTADCLPVMVLAPNLALSIHAGWRGIEQNIIGKSLAQLKNQGLDLNNAQAFIGPHIGPNSFEVDSDISLQLKNSYQNAGGKFPEKIILSHPAPTKAYVNLQEIALQQLTPVISQSEVLTLNLDTFTNLQFHSYRRNKTKGRQWSFCWLK